MKIVSENSIVLPLPMKQLSEILNFYCGERGGGGGLGFTDQLSEFLKFNFQDSTKQLLEILKFYLGGRGLHETACFWWIFESCFLNSPQ